MPNLKGNKLDLSDAKKTRSSKNGKVSKATSRQPADTTSDDEDDEDEDEDDEVLQASIKSKKEGGSKLGFILGAVGVVVVVVVGFIIFSGRNKQPTTIEPPSNIPPVETTQQQPQQTEQEQTQPVVVEPNVPTFGTQDFTQDTNNRSTSPMTNPDDFTKDIYGLTTRVDYDVARIQSVADFVSYTKHRGTWGGGLELYYLDVTYKENKYVMQVPFQYYKELDEVGIVPVKMEVLRIKSDTSDDYLSVISYMSLDEETLNTVMKSQQR